MNELRCSECGGELFLCISKIDVSDRAEKNDRKCRLTGQFVMWNKLISLACYDCGCMFDVCVGASDSDVSELKGLYDLDKLDNRRYDIHKKRIAAERLVFRPKPKRKIIRIKSKCDCDYPF